MKTKAITIPELYKRFQVIFADSFALDELEPMCARIEDNNMGDNYNFGPMNQRAQLSEFIDFCMEEGIIYQDVLEDYSPDHQKMRVRDGNGNEIIYEIYDELLINFNFYSAISKDYSLN